LKSRDAGRVLDGLVERLREDLGALARERAVAFVRAALPQENRDLFAALATEERFETAAEREHAGAGDPLRDREVAAARHETCAERQAEEAG
jgi:hypothetical protein